MTNSEESEKFFLCITCTKDPNLRQFLEDKAVSEKICTLCNQKKPAIPISQELTNLVRALIRCHFQEYKYNPHYGGERLEELLKFENPLITHEITKRDHSTEEIEDIHTWFLHELIGGIDPEENISLFRKNHPTIEKGIFFSAVYDNVFGLWNWYKTNLQYNNYFTLEEEAIKEIQSFLPDIVETLEKDNLLFRARIGFEIKTEREEFNQFKKRHPYGKESISAPPPYLAKAGRANRANVSFLYLSSNTETALAEVRPHPGHYISVGQFSNSEDIKIADFTKVNLIDYVDSDESFDRFEFLHNISESFTMPVLPEDQEKYLPSQFLSEIFRKLGISGIKFPSSVAEGYNIVSFYPEAFEYRENSSRLFKVTNLKYKYRTVRFEKDWFASSYDEKID